MIWNEFKIITNSEGAAMLEEVLAAIGIVGLATTDPGQLRQALEDSIVPWDYVDEALLSVDHSTLCFYLSDSEADKEMAKQVRLLFESLREDSKGSYGALSLTESKVDDSSWADNWKQYFKPLEIGNKLVIRPSWEQYTGPESKVVLEIDPASSFGTGQHETTALCLEALESEIESNEKPAVLLDMGCGSGILGVAGLLLAPDNIKYAIGVDIDENAVNTAIENALKNNVADRYKAFFGDVVANRYLKVKLKAQAERAGSARGFNIILANIVADVLVNMSETLLELAAPGAVIICSGIIMPKSSAVKAAFVSKGALVERELVRNDWAAIVIRKPLR